MQEKKISSKKQRFYSKVFSRLFTNRKKLSFYPKQLNLELSTRCNLKCIMCHSHQSKRLQPGGARYGDLKDMRIIRNLRSALPFIQQVELNGNGESLMNSEFVSVFSLVRKTVSRVQVTSNGLLLNEKIIRELVKKGIDDIFISIHAASAELYNTISFPGKIQNLIFNIDLINYYKVKYKTPKPRIKFQFVGMKKNIAELPSLIKLAAEKNVAEILVLNLIEYPLVKDQNLLDAPELLKLWLPRSIQLAKDLGVILTFVHNYQEIIDNKKTDEPVLPQNIIQSEVVNNIARDCLDPWTYAFVQMNGLVTPCCVMSSMYMGDLKVQSFEQIWFGEAYQDLRTRILNNDPPESCRQCTMRSRGKITDLRDKVKNL